jgi:hypothetical protein
MWRRRGVSRQYVGTLTTADGSLRLCGRDPETDIDVWLRVPFEEIESVRVSNEPPEVLSGEPCVVLELAGSEAICLREVGVTEPRLMDFADRLKARIIPPQLAAESRRRRRR